MTETRTAPDPEFQALVREKYADDAAAMTALGARLIVGRDAPRSVVDGVELISTAARRGDPGAWSCLAMLSAAGVGRVQNWEDAWSALERASELGDAHAARQCHVLRECGISSVPDLKLWLKPPAARILRDAPHFVAVRDFLAPPLCGYLMERSAARLIQAQVYDAYRGGLKVDPMRTNKGAAYSLIDTDLVMQLVRARIAQTASVPFDALEPLEILHYSVAERYKPHFDFFHPSLPNYPDEMRLRGQRIRTCLVYLNGDYEGGETEFPRIDFKFRGDVGEAFIFDNVLPDGTGDSSTLHAGLPPASGEKWLLSQWMRNKSQPLV